MSDFKAALKALYRQSSDQVLFDMAMGKTIRHGAIIASHIFQHRWRKYLSTFSELTHIDDEHNGLLLYKPVEWAFDRAKVCIEVIDGELRFHLLDSDLTQVTLKDVAKEIKWYNVAEEEVSMMTFGDLNGRLVEFPPNTVIRPSRRLLSLHAHASWIFSKTLYPDHHIPRLIYDITHDHSNDNLTMTIIRSIDKWKRSSRSGKLPIGI